MNYLPFNSVGNDRTYKAEDWAWYFSTFLSNGVFALPDGGLQVVKDSGMTVSVNAGFGFYEGYAFKNPEAFDITLSTADGSNPRIDRVVLRWDLDNRLMELDLLEGTAAASPTAPALTRTSSVYEFALADITVAAGATSISQSAITDQRADTDLCGYVTGTVEEVDFSQFTAQFNAYYAEFVAGNEAEFAEWFDRMKGQLSEDAAGNLQSQIDEINETNIPEVAGDLSDHEAENVNRAAGVHGFRYYNGLLQYYNTSASAWVDIDVQAVTPIGDVSNFSGSTDYTNITIQWSDPLDVVVDGVTLAKWAGTKLVRKEGSAPASESDGTLLIDNTVRDTYSSSGYVDSNLDAGIVYYYRVFPYTETGRITYGSYMAATTTPEGSTVLPTDDIQTWLMCGSVLGKSYTTLAEVLADTTTLLALISDENACDYLVRSTTWATDLCADSTAMTYIGANDYCSDILLSDDTWLDAICNSTYFESVLNVKVPTMTSNTTPSGEVIYVSSLSSGNTYRVFDGDDSTDGVAGTGTTSAGDMAIGYAFTSQVQINKIIIFVGAFSPSWIDHSSSIQFKIQASNDNSTWTDLTDWITGLPQEVNNSYILSNDNYYMYYRFYTTNGNFLSSVGDGRRVSLTINSMQFYGRAES